MNSRILCVIFALLLSGCAGAAATRPAALPLPGSPEAYLSDVMKSASSVSDVSGMVRLSITEGGKTSHSRNVFFVQQPLRLRIETLGFLSRPALFFTADETRIQLYDIQSNALFTGGTSPENFARLIGIPLDLREIVESFFGRPPLRECAEAVLGSQASEGLFEFTRTCGSSVEKIQIDPAVRRISRYEYIEAGLPVFSYTFSRFQTVDSRIFPLKIDIYHYTYKAAATMEFESLGFDQIPAERFLIKTPHTAQVRALDELGSPR